MEENDDDLGEYLQLRRLAVLYFPLIETPRPHDHFAKI